MGALSGVRTRVLGAALFAAVGVSPGAAAANTEPAIATPAREATPAAASASIGTRLPWTAHGGPHLLWTGFRAGASGGEVLLQTSAAVSLETRATKDGLVYVLHGCRILRRTDGLPLETRYFDTPVTRVSLRARAGSIEVAIALRHPVEVALRKQAGPNGSWFWVLSFPAGAAAAQRSPATLAPVARD